MNRAIFALAFALFILPILLIGRSEIITGENSVAYDAIIYFNVSKFIVVDFGPGWKELYASERIRPGEVKEVGINYNYDTTFIDIISDTNIPVNIAFGIYEDFFVNPFLERLTIDGTDINRGEYKTLIAFARGIVYRPSSISAVIHVPPGTPAGINSVPFIICVYDYAYSPYDVCPSLL